MMHCKAQCSLLTDVLSALDLAKDYYIDGLRTLAAKIRTMSAKGGPTLDPNYTPEVDFLDHFLTNYLKL